jgi:hypothetical protein
MGLAKRQRQKARSLHGRVPKNGIFAVLTERPTAIGHEPEI